MRIRSYECFCKALEVANNDFYRFLNRYAYEETITRLHMLETFEPQKYNEWLAKWKSERKWK